MILRCYFCVMEQFTFAEKADMHLMYGIANCNGRKALRLYHERFPNRTMPDHKIFPRLHRQLCDSGSFHVKRPDAGRWRHVRDPEMEERILRECEDNPSTSTRSIARTTGVSKSTVWKILHEERLFPYHLQRTQALKAADYPRRVDFCRWFLQQSTLTPSFSANVLFTDEATFTRDGMFNLHNSHVWATSNPYATSPHAFQERFSVNVWAGIVNDFLIGPYLLPNRLNGRTYVIFLEEVLPELLDSVPVAVRNTMWFQHDGAPSHFCNNVRNYLNAAFGPRWIGRGGPVAWPARSPDLSSIDFFLWGHLKALVYETPIDSDEDLIARLSIAAATVRETPGIFEKVRQSLTKRYQACIDVGGKTFEQLL